MLWRCKIYSEKKKITLKQCKNNKTETVKVVKIAMNITFDLNLIYQFTSSKM